MLSVAVRGLGGSALVLFGDEQAAGGGAAQNGRLAGGGGRVRDAGHVGAGAVQHGGDLPGLKLALVRLVAYLDDLAGVLHEVALVDGGRELDVLIAQEQGDVAVT